MFNPFILLTRQLLSKLMTSEMRYFVRQTFRRGEVKGVQPGCAFLLSGYKTHAEADAHLAQLPSDAHRALYDTQDPQQFRRLQNAAGGITGYAVYSNFRKGDWKPSIDCRRRISDFVRSMNWPAATETLSAELFERYGELFVTLQCGDHKTEVALARFEP